MKKKHENLLNLSRKLLLGARFVITSATRNLSSNINYLEEQADKLDLFIEENENNIGFYDLSKCNRVEVIDEDGRSYVNCDKKNSVEIFMQDDNRTLKIFIKKD